jgi:hypothetical protein
MANLTVSAAVDSLMQASNAAGIRSAAGLVIGSDVQAQNARLADVAGLAVTDGGFIVGNGTNFVLESGSTARASLGLATVANTGAYSDLSGTPTLGSLAALSSVNNGNWSGTDLAVTNGGTGASDASGARTNLLAVGSVVAGITGADAITNIVSLTQAEYDDIGTPNASTLYIITD